MDYYGNVMGVNRLPWLDDPFYNNKYPQYPQQPGGPNLLSGLLKSGAAANYNFTGINTKPQQNIAGEMANIANALYNTENPLYQHVYDYERQSAQQDLASVIAEMSNQNRKQHMLGRTPLFSPERGGEMMFRETVRGHQTAQDTARQRARQILGAGHSALGANFNNQGQIAQTQNQNKQKKAFGMGNIADLLPLLAKLF